MLVFAVYILSLCGPVRLQGPMSTLQRPAIDLLLAGYRIIARQSVAKAVSIKSMTILDPRAEIVQLCFQDGECTVTETHNCCDEKYVIACSLFHFFFTFFLAENFCAE